MNNENKKKILRKVCEIVNLGKDESDGKGKYIYRGQSDATHSYVASSLYRAMGDSYKEIKGEEWLNMNRVQEEALKTARKFGSEGYGDEEMLSHIQHYSGDTNLIDFTKDYLVALFFACNQKYGKKADGGQDGEVFLLDISNLKNLKNNGIEIITPVHPRDRVITQRSIFVQSRSGIIHKDKGEDKDEDKVTLKVVTISLDLKQPILGYLKAHHGISLPTIYNDLHGYIRNSREQKNAVMEFYMGLSYMRSNYTGFGYGN